jgi:hypothetical protein
MSPLACGSTRSASPSTSANDKMARARCTFRERDVRTAIKAAVAAGIEVAAVEIGAQGEIRIVVGKPVAQELSANEWDEVLPHGKDTQIR